MVDFKDKTSEENGTPINRENLMAMQGFIANNTVFNADGSITETFVGEKTITKTTTFNSDGSISEAIV